ncbi:MAG: dihydrofolate reductase [Pirellulales bacterium]|nr:dihydrofolate reductase [Pirellulales bacterium]
MIFSMIVAVSENGVIGRGGDLPWHLSADLRRFKAITMGHTLMMGRKTWESIGRPLPGRQMVILSRQENYRVDGAEVVPDFDKGRQLAEAHGETEVFVIGGAEIYRQALSKVERLYLTRVHASVEGDTCLPEIAWENWKLLESERHEVDDKHQFAYSFQTFTRIVDRGKTGQTLSLGQGG